jgi:hypothetical protein
MAIDPNFILNGCTLALLIWVAGSVSGLRERVARIESQIELLKGKKYV